MTPPLCSVPTCAYPSPDAFVCRSCTAKVVAELMSIGGPDGLLAELIINMTRQDVTDPLPGTTSDEPPLLYRPEATETARDLHATLSTWVRHLVESRGLSWGDVIPHRRPRGAPFGPERPPIPATINHRHTPGTPPIHGYQSRFPGDDTVELARWLARHPDTIRQDEAGGELVDEIGDAIARCLYAIDRPAARVYLGACDCTSALEPQVDLYARPDSARVRCRACEQVWDVADRRAVLLQQSERLLVTGEVATRALPGLLGATLTFDTLRALRRRHGLVTYPPGSDDPLHRPRYRVGEIVAAVVAARAAVEARRAGGDARPPTEGLPEELRALFDTIRLRAAIVQPGRQPVQDA